MIQSVIPETYVPVVVRLNHDERLAGHPGKQRTLLAARRKYYWLIMRIDIDAYVARCVKRAQHIVLNGPSRAKRGLMDGIGKLSRMLFGTAMDEDVEQLRGRYNHLTSIASAEYRAIHINCRNIARLEKHVSDLGLYVNQLKSELNNILTNVYSMCDFMTITQLLSVMETAVNSLLHANQLVVQNVVDAANGRVSPTLFQVRNFLHGLNIGKVEYELKPLFDIEGIHHYFSYWNLS